jgi:hypothetical protein
MQNATKMPVMNTPFQIVTEVPEPLCLFFRPGRGDHTTIAQLVSENRIGMSGVVFDPCHIQFQKELRSDLTARELYTVLDTGMMELAWPGTATPERTRLPWGHHAPHSPTDFDSKRVDRIARSIAEFVQINAFNCVLAPTHYLTRGVNDPWFLIDRRLTLELRQQLDRLGCNSVQIHYPVALPTSCFFDAAQRTALKSSLSDLNLDAVWLRIHPFGSHSGGITLQRYLTACQQFHDLKLPLIAEKTGNLGLALLAFGAVTGIESGVSAGEQFNVARFRRRPPKGKRFSARPRVYMPQLGIFLTRAETKELFRDSSLRHYACRDTSCCQHGFASMLSDPRRHFVFTRMEEIGALSAAPEKVRSLAYLQRTLRPADDHLGRILSRDTLANPLIHRLRKRQRRLHGWRKTLTEFNRAFPPQSFSQPLQRHILNARATA